MQNKMLLRLERKRRPRNTCCAANQQPNCNTIEFRFWKARTPPPKIAVAHFLRACGVGASTPRGSVKKPCMHTSSNTAADGETSEIAATLWAATRKRRVDRPTAGRTRTHHQAARANQCESEKAEMKLNLSENENSNVATKKRM